MNRSGQLVSAGVYVPDGRAGPGVVNIGFHVQRALRWWGRVLGGGAGFVTAPETGTGRVGGGGRCFHAPAHIAAIVYHEVGHHVCRHSADFRLNRLRPVWGQTNKKTALDEGTADVLTAVLLDTPDIYGWHRGTVTPGEQRRRRLDPRWSMAHFQGERGPDPHADGTVWASACWSARQHIIDTDTGTDPAPHLHTAMAHHGIHPGLSNHDLSHNARTHQLVRA